MRHTLERAGSDDAEQEGTYSGDRRACTGTITLELPVQKPDVTVPVIEVVLK